MGLKAMRDFGPKFLWILAGIPAPGDQSPFQFYVIPSREMAHNVKRGHFKWLRTPGKKGQPHKDSKVRVVPIPPRVSNTGWNISKFKDRWDFIDHLPGFSLWPYSINRQFENCSW